MSVLNEGTREGATQRTSEKDDVFKEKAEKAHIHEKLGRLLSFGRWSIVALRPPIHQIFIWIHEYCSPSTTLHELSKRLSSAISSIIQVGTNGTLFSFLSRFLHFFRFE